MAGPARGDAVQNTCSNEQLETGSPRHSNLVLSTPQKLLVFCKQAGLQLHFLGLLPPPPSLLPSPLPHPQTPPSRLQPPLACDVTPSAVTDPVSKCVTFPLLSLYPQNPPPSLLVGINSLIAEGHTAVGKTSKAVQRPNLLFVSRLF